jgi:S-formylglutathione hydrolase FrmB
VDGRYRTIQERERRAITGKSSGGYGAMVTPMLRPDLWGGLATHAGDSLFEDVYLPEFRQVARTLRDDYGGSYERFWQDFRSRPALSRESDAYMLDVWCMAACYSADPDGTVRLPFEPKTGRIRPEIWERWLAWDPVRMVPDHAEILRGLRAIYIDAGNRDQFYLDLGAEAFRAALERIGVTDVFFELFEGKHGGIVWRYPISLKYLAERLSDGESASASM